TKKLLGYFFLNPDARLYVNEIARKLSLDRGNLIKKLREAEKEGIFNSEFRGNQKYYSLNKKYPLYKEIQQLFLKTQGIERELKDGLSKIKDIKEAYLFGSYVKNKMDANSDIDILIVGEDDTMTTKKILNQIQKDFGREINAVEMTEKEFNKRRKNKDTFIADVFKNKFIKII
ncbi:nucleotidyltransferase domain-containing protein, partial [Patescibacteria group bacterium]|nr:nucleotidyltransferase domain-containing protein [Patescibacteria group bacterium]MCG2693245.1 nucleotidyltransferase domain-containing protein [Candidatus Parcubacteria bacterium]